MLSTTIKKSHRMTIAISKTNMQISMTRLMRTSLKKKESKLKCKVTAIMYKSPW